MSFAEVKARLAHELSSLQADISRLMQAAVEAGTASTEADDAVVISGEQAAGCVDIVADMDRLRGMFACRKTELCSLTPPAVPRGTNLYRGDSSWCRWMTSVVTAPYGVDGKVVGTGSSAHRVWTTSA